MPTRLSITASSPSKSAYQLWSNQLDQVLFPVVSSKSLDNLKKSKNSFQISKASRRKIYDTINNLYALSSPRVIEMKTGKRIYNFRASFITLTLPAVQFHSDKKLKNGALNQLLVELRKAYGMQNYFWKAELQGNENIHFHIITDRYIDYQALRRRWNRIIEKLGYIAKYQAKFQAMSVLQYHAHRNQKYQCDFSKSAAAYAAGCRANWKSPNTVDVKSIKNRRSLGAYLSKYMAKSTAKDSETGECSVRAVAFGRAWARSQSLSRLEYSNKFLYEELRDVIHYLSHKKEGVTRVVGQFFTVFYFNPSQLSEGFQRFLTNYLRGNALNWQYPLVATG